MLAESHKSEFIRVGAIQFVQQIVYLSRKYQTRRQWKGVHNGFKLSWSNFFSVFLGLNGSFLGWNLAKVNPTISVISRVSNIESDKCWVGRLQQYFWWNLSTFYYPLYKNKFRVEGIWRFFQIFKTLLKQSALS